MTSYIICQFQHFIISFIQRHYNVLLCHVFVNVMCKTFCRGIIQKQRNVKKRAF